MYVIRPKSTEQQLPSFLGM